MSGVRALLGRLHAAQRAFYRFRGDLVAACWPLPPDPTAFDGVWA
jgi:hypothetical protein